MYAEYQSFKGERKAFQPHKLVPTSKDIEGPFYKEGAPERQLFVEVPTLYLRGKVYDEDGAPLAGALLDFWQADEKGTYDNDGYRLRGKQKADAEGNYVLGTVHPGHYPIGNEEFRCSHIHVKVSADGHKPLTTQLYFSGDEYNDEDHWFDPARVVAFVDRRQESAMFDIVLAKG